jgi:hypothetical protein
VRWNKLPQYLAARSIVEGADDEQAWQVKCIVAIPSTEYRVLSAIEQRKATKVRSQNASLRSSDATICQQSTNILSVKQTDTGSFPIYLKCNITLVYITTNMLQCRGLVVVVIIRSSYFELYGCAHHRNEVARD